LFQLTLSFLGIINFQIHAKSKLALSIF